MSSQRIHILKNSKLISKNSILCITRRNQFWLQFPRILCFPQRVNNMRLMREYMFRLPFLIKQIILLVFIIIIIIKISIAKLNCWICFQKFPIFIPSINHFFFWFLSFQILDKFVFFKYHSILPFRVVNLHNTCSIIVFYL